MTCVVYESVELGCKKESEEKITFSRNVSPNAISLWKIVVNVWLPCALVRWSNVWVSSVLYFRNFSKLWDTVVVLFPGPEASSVFKSKFLCIRFWYKYHEEAGYFHTFKVPKVRAFNNSIIEIKNIEDEKGRVVSLHNWAVTSLHNVSVVYIASQDHWFHADTSFNLPLPSEFDGRCN